MDVGNNTVCFKKSHCMTAAVGLSKPVKLFQASICNSCSSLSGSSAYDAYETGYLHVLAAFFSYTHIPVRNNRQGLSAIIAWLVIFSLDKTG